MADRTLRVIVAGEDRGASTVLNNVASKSDHLAARQDVLASSFGKAKTELLSLVPGGQQAASALDKVKGSSEGTGLSMSSALAGGVAVAGAAIATMTVKGVQQYSALTGEVRKYQNVTGASAQEASKMIAVTKALGVDTEALTTGMFRSGAQIAKNADQFTAAGVAIAHNKNGTVDLTGTLKNAAAAYQRSADATERDNIAKLLGGKRGQELIPILKATSSEIDGIAKAAQDRGEIITQADVDAGVEYRKSMRELDESVKGIEMSLAKGLVPALTSTAEGLTTVIDLANKIHVPDALLKISQAANPFAVYGAAKKDFEEWRGGHEKAAAAANDQNAAEAGLAGTTKAEAASFDAAGAALKRQTENTKSAADAMESMKSTTMGVANAQRGLQDANQGVADATSGLAAAHRRLDDLLRKGAVDQRAVTSAQREFESSSRSAADAQDRLTDARKAFDAVLAGPSVRNQTDANLRVQETADGILRANLRLAEAQKKLSDLQTSGTASSDDLASAQLDVHDASRGVTKAQEDAADAQQALNDLMASGTPGSKEYESARKAVKDAEQGVKDAQQQVLDSQKALTDAQKGDVTFSQQVLDAKANIAQAERGVKTAKDNVTTATLNLFDAQQKETQALADGGAAALDYLTYLQGIAATYPELANDPLLAVLRNLVAPAATKQLGDIPMPFARGGGARASGGPVSAGELYKVNDAPGNPTEYFVPASSGSIALGPTDGGGLGTLTLVTPVMIDGREVARATATYTQAELLKMARRNGTTGIN